MKTVILQKEHSYREYPLADRGTIGTKEYRIEDGILFLDCEEIRPYCRTQLEEESVIYIPEEHRCV